MMHFQVCFKKAFQRHSKTSELCSQFVGIILLQRILGQEETAIADTHAQAGIQTTEEVRGYTVFQHMVVPWVILLHNMGNPILTHITD